MAFVFLNQRAWYVVSYRVVWLYWKFPQDIGKLVLQYRIRIILYCFFWSFADPASVVVRRLVYAFPHKVLVTVFSWMAHMAASVFLQLVLYLKFCLACKMVNVLTKVFRWYLFSPILDSLELDIAVVANVLTFSIPNNMFVQSTATIAVFIYVSRKFSEFSCIHYFISQCNARDLFLREKNNIVKFCKNRNLCDQTIKTHRFIAWYFSIVNLCSFDGIDVILA